MRKRIPRKRIPIKQEEEKQTEPMRLNKYLAHAGVASRRKADEIIAAGKVLVNGEVVTEMGYKVQPDDTVTFKGEELVPEKKVYILLNKPKDVITTTDDEKGRKTVMDVVKPALRRLKMENNPRIYPVGRLDRNTTGVLLITNDGELAQRLTHPSHNVEKVYRVNLDKPLAKADFDQLLEGVELSDGEAKADELAYPNANDKSVIGIRIHIGKNRIVRRMFDHLGYKVMKLDRVLFAGLTKKDLQRGYWRILSPQEVRRLKQQNR